MNHTQEEKTKALEYLEQYKGQELLAVINSVSRSGMSRRIEFYGISKATPHAPQRITRIGWSIAKVIDWSYDVNKGGILVKGCGMDMIFHTLYTFNVVSARIKSPTKTTQELYSNKTANGYWFPTSYTT